MRFVSGPGIAERKQSKWSLETLLLSRARAKEGLAEARDLDRWIAPNPEASARALRVDRARQSPHPFSSGRPLRAMRAPQAGLELRQPPMESMSVRAGHQGWSVPRRREMSDPLSPFPCDQLVQGREHGSARAASAPPPGEEILIPHPEQVWLLARDLARLQPERAQASALRPGDPPQFLSQSRGTLVAPERPRLSPKSDLAFVALFTAKRESRLRAERVRNEDRQAPSPCHGLDFRKSIAQAARAPLTVEQTRYREREPMASALAAEEKFRVVRQ